MNTLHGRAERDRYEYVGGVWICARVCVCVCVAYRRVCLEHHPDKKLAGVTDDAEKAKVEDYFKQVGVAMTHTHTCTYAWGQIHTGAETCTPTEASKC